MIKASMTHPPSEPYWQLIRELLTTQLMAELQGLNKHPLSAANYTALVGMLDAILSAAAQRVRPHPQ